MIFDSYQSIFEKTLLSDIESQKYLNSRCITFESIKKFKLGSANNYYDIIGNFFCSITIPSINIYNEIVGFFGRRIYNLEPKYIISKNYNKSSNILGLLQAQNNIIKQEYAIITEGIFDMIMMHQCGFENTISSPGKDWSERQISFLRRYTDKVILLFDNDNEGVRATEKYLKLLPKFGFFVLNIRYPEKFKDIDKFLKDDPEAIKYLKTKLLGGINDK